MKLIKSNPICSTKRNIHLNKSESKKIKIQLKILKKNPYQYKTTTTQQNPKEKNQEKKSSKK